MFSNVIRDNYLVHMTVNGLPSAYEVKHALLVVCGGSADMLGSGSVSVT